MESKKPTIRENLVLPANLADVMPKIISGARVHNQVLITKKDIFAELIKLLKMAKIDPKRVTRASDVTTQLAEYIKKKK